MRNKDLRAALWVQAVILLIVVLVCAVAIAFSEEPATTAPQVVLCRQSLGCLQQMVDDLRQYRTYLEDQLALAKSVLDQANQQISRQAKELEALKGAAEAAKKKELTK